MKAELYCCTSTLLQDISSKECNKRAVAQTYALSLKSSEETDWEKVNQAIIKRWSRSALEDIKKLAWSGKCFDKVRIK
jgi:hypothetical protein